MKKQVNISIVLFLLIFSTLAEQVIIATPLPVAEEIQMTTESSTLGVGKLDQLINNDESTEASPRETPSEELRSPSIKLDDETQGIAAFSGTGTEQDPFTAGTAAELETVTEMIRTIPGAGPFHIHLTADIVLRNNVPMLPLGTRLDRFNLYKDTVIDGQGYHLLIQNDSRSYFSFFETRNNGINLTFQNINFGSNQLVDQNGIIYGRQGMYGIISSINDYSLNFNMVMENINFYTNYSLAEAVWQGYNDESYFHFRGDNQIIFDFTNRRTSIISSPNIIYEEDSSTYIECGPGLYIFYVSGNSLFPELGTGNLNIQQKNNAKVEIITGKEGLAYAIDSATMTIGEEAELSVRGSSTSNMSIIRQSVSAEGTAILNVNQNAVVDIVNQSNFRLNNLTINVDQPKYFRMEALDNTPTTMANNATMKRLDGVSGETGGYQVTSIDVSGQIFISEVSGGGSFGGDTMLYGTNRKGFLYQRKFAIDELEAVPEVDVGISRLTTSINAVEPVGRPLTRYQLKLSRTRLWRPTTLLPTINSLNTQRVISNATLATNGVLAIESSETESSWQKEKLTAGTYYVYVRVTGVMQDDPELQKYLSESLWHEIVIEVPKSPMSAEVPLEKFFRVREIGEFDETANALPIISHSNFPIDFKVTDVVEQSTDSAVTLVNSTMTDAFKHLQLRLAATNGQHTGPLTVGSNQENAIQVLPFLDDPLKLYLKGHYSGPIDGRHDVTYKFTYQLTPR